MTELTFFLDVFQSVIVELNICLFWAYCINFYGKALWKRTAWRSCINFRPAGDGANEWKIGKREWAQLFFVIFTLWENLCFFGCLNVNSWKSSRITHNHCHLLADCIWSNFGIDMLWSAMSVSNCHRSISWWPRIALNSLMLVLFV